MQLRQFILRLLREGPTANDVGQAELIERRRTGMATRTPALSAAAGVQSWHDIALSAIEYGDEDFAGELVRQVERQLRQMS